MKTMKQIKDILWVIFHPKRVLEKFKAMNDSVCKYSGETWELQRENEILKGKVERLQAIADGFKDSAERSLKQIEKKDSIIADFKNQLREAAEKIKGLQEQVESSKQQKVFSEEKARQIRFDAYLLALEFIEENVDFDINEVNKDEFIDAFYNSIFQEENDDRTT